MSSLHTPLYGKKVGVIGFNARPLACSVRKAGGLPYVSDYWGDSDLDACSEEWIAVLSPVPGSRQRGSLEAPVHISLSENFEHSFSIEELDYILIGSGFDDHTDSLLKIEDKHGITGNSVKLMNEARNKERLANLADSLELQYPKYETVVDLSEARTAISEIGFPCVLRPITSGGGAGIRKFNSYKKIESFYKTLEKSDRLGPRIVQEFVSGIDVSASVLGTGKDSMTISVQDQLIGLPSAGRLSDFVYCGNRIPVSVDDKTRDRVRDVSEALTSELHLKGSIGIDYVVDQSGEIWLFEVNPRFQGSLEMLETASNISVSEFHIEACRGTLPESIPIYRPTTKMIVYANRDGIVPDLMKWPNTVDRSPRGVEVHKGDPICSIIDTGEDGSDVFSRVQSISGQILDEI
ncbi:MAG: ATP-grasp domain-containing protein [Candidatus Thorarchaeota archaeon]|jgi:predicted ATP-grasp superfamily ATP-dependent carboligase